MKDYCVIIDWRQKTVVNNRDEAERLVLANLSGYGSYIAVIENGICTEEIMMEDFEVLKQAYPKIDGKLLTKLVHVFPKSFNLVREYEIHDYIPGSWGIEKTFVDTGIECLADCILNTAEAFRKKYGIERSLDYVQQFSKPRIQKSEGLNYCLRSEL